MELVFYEPMPLWAVMAGLSGFVLLVSILISIAISAWAAWRGEERKHLVNYQSPTIRDNLKRVK